MRIGEVGSAIAPHEVGHWQNHYPELMESEGTLPTVLFWFHFLKKGAPPKALVVGIYLARKGSHDAVILRRETGLLIGRSFRFCSSPKGMDKLFGRIDAVRQKGEPVDSGIDSPGRAWVPVAAVLTAKGYCVYRPSANRMRRIRQAGHGRNKTNRIDALTLASCLMSFPQDTSKVFLPQGLLARLDGLVGQRHRAVDSLRRRKQRIEDLCEAINPGLATVPEGFLPEESGMLS